MVWYTHYNLIEGMTSPEYTCTEECTPDLEGCTSNVESISGCAGSYMYISSTSQQQSSIGWGSLFEDFGVFVGCVAILMLNLFFGMRYIYFFYLCKSGYFPKYANIFLQPKNTIKGMIEPFTYRAFENTLSDGSTITLNAGLNPP